VSLEHVPVIKKPRRAALYVRVSTDRQTVENQIESLTRVAEQRGWEIIEVYRDAGISGTTTRKDRPGLDRLLTNASRAKFNVVMVWAIDRLGRSTRDLLDNIEALEGYGVDIFIQEQDIDTTSPAGKLVFTICGAIATFERTLIQARVRAGLERARKAGKRLGRPNIPAETETAIRAALARGGKGILKIAAEYKVGSSVVQRIKRELTGAGASG
jgi:DNA invertase Pin-like site-specific DNA recombinase